MSSCFVFFTYPHPRDVVSHMNKDWMIMSSKFSELCRENAHLTSTINGLQKTLTETQAGIKETQKDNQSKIEQIASNISELKSEKNPQDEDEERENEKIRMLNVRHISLLWTNCRKTT